MNMIIDLVLLAVGIIAALCICSVLYRVCYHGRYSRLNEKAYYALFDYMNIDHYVAGENASTFTLRFGVHSLEWRLKEKVDHFRPGSYEMNRWWGIWFVNDEHDACITVYKGDTSRSYQMPWAVVQAEDGQEHFIDEFQAQPYYDPYTRQTMEVHGYRYYYNLAPLWLKWCKLAWRPFHRIEVNFPQEVGRRAFEDNWKGGTRSVSCPIDPHDSIEDFLLHYTSD